MTKPKYKQFIWSCRRKCCPKSFSNYRHTRHYGLATRKRRPLSQRYDRFSQEVFELSQYIDAFGKAILFRRVPREGHIWSALHEGDNWNDWKNKSRKKKTNSETWQDCGGHHGDDPNLTHPSAHCPRCKPKKYRNQPNGAWETSGHWKKYSRWTYYNPNKRASAYDWSPHSEAFSSCNMRQQRMRRCNRRNTVYKPTIGNGIPMSQLKVLTSPIAATFFANGNVPLHLNNITERFKAATDPKQAIEEYQKLHRVPKNKVIWDSGASHTLSPCKKDFNGPIQPAPIGLRIKGIARGLHIAGVGYVRWSFIDKTGRLRTLKVPAYYVPSASVRLLSTTSLLQAYPLEEISQSSTLLTMIGTKDLLSRDNVRQDEATNSIEVAIDPATDLPTSLAYDHGSNSNSTNFEAEFNNFVTTTTSNNHNLSPAAHELMKWNHRLGHLNFKQIQFLLRTGVLAHAESTRRLQAAASKLTTLPLCAGCQFGKQRRRPAPGKTSRVVRDPEGALQKDNLFPGQKVSVHLNTHETLQGKEAFENKCREFGVIVSEYQSDNGGAFTSRAYTEHLRQFEQSSFAGVGAHHHNGIAERSIQTIMSIARTMMLHQAIHWPDVAAANCWPLAVDQAVFLYNHMPDPTTGLSPNDLISRTRWPQSRLTDVHVWGCPVYVLEKKIQDGQKLPWWQPRSTRQIYVGLSKKHASSVPLCLNPATGAITSQFHIVFDDEFSTIATSVDDLPDFGSNEWMKLFGDSIYQYIVDDDHDHEPPVDQAPSDLPPLVSRVRDQIEHHRPSEPLDVKPPPTTVPPTVGLSNQQPSLQREIPLSSLQKETPLPSLQRETANEAPPSQPSAPQREMNATPKEMPQPPTRPKPKPTTRPWI
ncbi:unnamed protein product [Cylindrotheca closterium]|uniref:Integrase catalytic domain-containing protein n=1 Tax=Cylindrotheca closterium TaxID=2856 RepID=A0AAD2CNZ4_9STRA|nr:unnamed protein product [Cylindrotheca closterium]